jgi:hypothetical protein
MNIYIDRILPKKLLLEDVVIAVGTNKVLFVRFPYTKCVFCIEATSALVEHIICTAMIDDIGTIQLFVLVPAIKGPTLEVVYSNDESDVQKHKDVLMKRFINNENKRWQASLKGYFPQQNLDQPKIIQVGNWNKNGIPAIRINDLDGSKILVNNRKNPLDKLTENIPL